MPNPNEISDIEITKWLLENKKSEINDAEDFFVRMWNNRPTDIKIKYDDLWRMFESMLEREPYKQFDQETLLAYELVHRLAFIRLRERLKEELS